MGAFAGRPAAAGANDQDAALPAAAEMSGVARRNPHEPANPGDVHHDPSARFSLRSQVSVASSPAG
jgi:hypothetical protein